MRSNINRTAPFSRNTALIFTQRVVESGTLQSCVLLTEETKIQSDNSLYGTCGEKFNKGKTNLSQMLQNLNLCSSHSYMNTVQQSLVEAVK
jgi:hypothetical protein